MAATALIFTGCSVSSYTSLRLEDVDVPSDYVSISGQPSWAPLTLMPLPRHIEISEQRFTLPETIMVSVENVDSPRLRRAIARWVEQVSRQTGRELSLQWAGRNAKATLSVSVSAEGAEYPRLDSDESYELVVTDQGVRLAANSGYGALRGLQTLRQLVVDDTDALVLPQVTISDAPQWRWRGVTVDTARHFMPVAAVKRTLDAMEMVKLNVLHLHLTDDQGFSIESKLYPNLHEKGSQGGDQYYRQDEIKELIEYAADRGIRVVPEFGLPGHSLSWQVAYPEMSVPGQPEPQLGRWTDMFSPPIDPTRPETYDMLEKLTAEMAALFPDQYYHIGSDEVNDKPWKNDPDIRAFMRDNDLESTANLHGYFARRYADIVLAQGKYPIGWEEALHAGPDSDKPMVMHLWLKGDYPAEFAGHPIIMSRDYYLDQQQPAWWLYRQGVTDFTIEGVDDVSSQVLGAEVSMWSEYVDGRTLDMEVWPRSAALAERYWTPPSRLVVNDLNDLYRRLDAVSARMDAAGIQHLQTVRDFISEIAGEGDADALMTLAEVVEPSGYYYQRNTKRMLQYAFSFLPFIDTPPYAGGVLTRFVEHLPSESTRARHFWEKVDRYLSGETSLAGDIQGQLQIWAANHERLAPTIAASPRLNDDELDTVSAGLSEIARVGLEALEAIESEEGIGALRGWWLEERLDDYDYGIFHFDNFQEIIYGAIKPDVLQQHNIAIQPSVVRLLQAARAL